jgi:hypothetical protein
VATKRRRVKKQTESQIREDGAQAARDIFSQRQREAKAKGMVEATRERREAEDLDDQAKQAVERDDARDERKGRGFYQPPSAGYKPGDVARDVRRLKNEQGIGLPDVEPGTVIRVTNGAEKYSPIQFHTFDVGGNFIDITVREGETIDEAWRRGFAVLEYMIAQEFQAKLSAYADRILAADSHVRERARR